VPRSRITIRDVAARAGVSHQTVSRVINNSASVRPKTRDKVMAAINEMGYSPNAIARSMAKGRTSMLACISPNLTDYTLSSIIEGAERQARQQGYYLVSSSAEDEQTFADLLNELIKSRRVEGLLVINPYVDSRYQLIHPKTPSFFIGAHSRLKTISSVALDDYGVAKKATEYLIKLGHHRIAMVTGPRVEDCTLDRDQGYKQALAEAKLPFIREMVIIGDWSATSGYEAMYQLVEQITIPTAVFAQNDRMAVGVLRAARELDIHVPQQLNVIGIDDMPLASYFDPPLTTMRQDMFEIGSQAARLLIRSLEMSQAPSQHLRIPGKLIIRRSTSKIFDHSDSSFKEVRPAN
jgi:DNA-binding LacI/PurR family transcriptional regulator